ncbi:MAG: sigma-70 family RNA polymerase sigma factor [bacterium]
MLRKKEAKKRVEFEALVMPHLEALYGTAVRMTRNPQEADDLLQDSCLKAFRFLDKYQRGTNFKAWIFKILTNVFINRYRKAQRDREIRNEVEMDGHHAHILAQGPTREAQWPEEAILDHLMSEDIRAALEKLPPDFRMAIILSDVEEFSYKEIAEIMDCPVGTVMSRLYRARRQLQRLLLKHAVDRGIVSAEVTGEDDETARGEAMAEVTDLTAYRNGKQR